MAASRSALKNTNVVSSTGRISFAKIHEPLEVPNLLDLQIDAYNWLIGNEAWQAKVAEQLAAGRTDVNTRSGLEEIFAEIERDPVGIERELRAVWMGAPPRGVAGRLVDVAASTQTSTGP